MTTHVSKIFKYTDSNMRCVKLHSIINLTYYVPYKIKLYIYNCVKLMMISMFEVTSIS